MKAHKAVVSKRALVQRINRALAHEDQKLVANTGGQNPELGDFYIVEMNLGVVHMDIDLESLGRKLKVLKPWEKMEKSI